MQRQFCSLVILKVGQVSHKRRHFILVQNYAKLGGMALARQRILSLWQALQKRATKA
jgi:hypothetical protein